MPVERVAGCSWIRRPDSRGARTFVRAASRKWRRLNGANQLPRVIKGVKFTDGVAKTDDAQNRAA